MKHKEINSKFNKKTIKSFKIHEHKDKKDFEDYYSRIVLNFFESDKKKEERKNSNDNNIKLKKFNKLKLSSNNSNKDLKIKLNGNNKMYNKKHIDINKNNDSTINGRKTANANKKIVTKKLIQCISEKNIKSNKNSEKNLKVKHNTKIELLSLKKKNDFSNHKKIRLNLHKNNDKQLQKKYNNINKVILNDINNNKEKKNKSMNKRKQIKTKNSESEKSINLRINIKEKMNNKISNHQLKQYNNKNNKNNIIDSNNKNIIKSKKSPENLRINEYIINNKKRDKNLNKSKKINDTDINSSSKIFNKKKIIKSTGNISSKNIFDKNNKINTLKKHLIDKKGIKNICLNSLNSKINNSTKQDIFPKRIKVESIKIDLNLVKPPKNYSFISQEKTTAENYNYKLNDKNDLTLRITDITKFKNKNRFTEINTLGQNEMSELNQSFKTSFSLYKSRSLSKKREEKKRSKLNNLELLYDSEENNKKLNNILICLSNLNSKNEKVYEQKSEPKKLIDRIRKYKKLQKL